MPKTPRAHPPHPDTCRRPAAPAASAAPATAPSAGHKAASGAALTRGDLELLLRIADGGTLAAAARQLDRSPPAVSKQLAALEARLGARLLHRTTRRLQFTAEGEAALAHARDIVAGYQRLDEALSGRRDEVRGRLRVLSSPGFGRLWLAPVLGALQAAEPGLQIDLHLVDHLPDFAAGGFDAAVWLWQPTRGSWVTRRLARNRRIVVAAPAYLARHGTPATPDDLQHHRCLVVRENDEPAAVWRLAPLQRRGAQAVAVRVGGPLVSNHGEVVRDWALAGHGLMLRSLWDVAAPLARGELVHVLPDWAMLDADVHLVLPPRAPGLQQPKRLQVLQQHLVAALADEPWMKAAALGAALGAAISAVPAPPPGEPPAPRRQR